MRKQFNQIVDMVIRVLGTPAALAGATLVVLIWAITGPLFGFSDTWQLVINTATTIVTFLMVFVIQNGANRDAKAVHIKLDELIRVIDGARNHLVLAEHQTEEEQDREMRRLVKVAKRAAASPTPDAIEDLAEATEDAAEAVAEEAAVKRDRAPRTRSGAGAARTSTRRSGTARQKATKPA